MRTRCYRVAVLFSVVSLIVGCASTTTQAPKENRQKSSPKETVPKDTASYPPYYGPKKRIAVVRFENKVRNQWWDQSWEIGDGLAEMVTTELFKTNRFILVERAAFADIVKEQELGQTGLVQQATAAKAGQALGAQILVFGGVTEFKYEAQGGGAGVRISGIGVGLSGSNAHVAIDLRMVDAETGQVIEAHRVAGKASKLGVGLSREVRGMTFGGTTFNETPIGEATRKCISQAVDFVVRKSESIAWSGALVKVEDEKVFVNAGANCNVKSGDIMIVFSKGETLTDPTTGLALGATLKLAGEIQIEAVDDKFSSAKIISGTGMKRGDLVRYK